MITRLRAPAVVRLCALFAVAATFVLATTAFASAAGTLVIQHAGQDAQTYDGVKVQVIHDTLNVTSPDGKGTLIVTRAACWYQHKIFVCLPTAVTLVQGGNVHALDLRKGTVYSNLNATTQTLSHSTTQLPPNGILMTLETQKGTYINLVGTIDKVTQ